MGYLPGITQLHQGLNARVTWPTSHTMGSVLDAQEEGLGKR